ncbi:hypothetical protein [uncultured Methylobacterium sp.]|uniref:hypothetical protein n=1 Tax=uncultured Methylobacterium sp. TaxID=157278 RepID=UPI0035CA4CA7
MTAPVDPSAREHIARERADEIARRQAALTRRTIVRFGEKLVGITMVGACAWLVGLPAILVLAGFCVGNAALSALRMLAVRDRGLTPYLGHFDEAVWFLLLGLALRTVGGR